MWLSMNISKIKCLIDLASKGYTQIVYSCLEKEIYLIKREKPLLGDKGHIKEDLHV